MTRSTRISGAVITGFVAFAAHSHDGALLLGHLLPPTYLACLYVIVTARCENGTHPTLIRSALMAGLAQGVLGLLGWTVIGFFPYAFPIHVAFLATSGMLFGAVAGWVTRQASPAHRVLGFALAWVVIAVGSGGFSWGYPTFLSGSLATSAVLAQPLALGGPWLLDGLTALVGASLGEGLLGLFELQTPGRRRWALRTCLGVPIGVAIAVSFGGLARLATIPPTVLEDPTTGGQEATPVSVIQGGVPGWYLKHAAGWSSLQEVMTDLYADLVEAESPWLRPHTSPWVVLPESAIYDILPPGDSAWPPFAGVVQPGHPGAYYMTTVSSLRAETTPKEQEYQYRFLVGKADPSGMLQPVGEASKSILIPFADRQYAESEHSPLIDVNGTSVGALICWDAMFPHLTRQLAQDGAEIFVATASTSRALGETAPAWHARMARMRAVETGRTLVFASQGGPSFVTDSAGRVVSQLPFGAQGSIRVWVTPQTLWTPYLTLGPWILPFCTFLLLLQCWRASSQPVP